VQLGLPLGPEPSLPRRGPAWLERGGTRLFVHLIRVRAARRYVLRVRPDGALRVTIPLGGSRADALRFAERHLSWALRERTRLLAGRRTPLVWTPGSLVRVNGELMPIVLTPGDEHDIARLGDAITVRVPRATPDLRPALEGALREAARRELPAQLLAIAARLGLNVSAVSIRNQRSRWGSCSSSGRIALNFRLLQMPSSVREYILVHELMHLRQPNHSRRFWALVQEVCPAFRDAERWLRTTGRTLF
jgi:hypothetical protein